MSKNKNDKVIFDYSKLLGKMKEKGITQAELADVIGVRESTLCLKLKSKSEFKALEMIRILMFLDVSIADIALYFFCTNTFENAS